MKNSSVHLNENLKTPFTRPFILWSDRGFVRQKTAQGSKAGPESARLHLFLNAINEPHKGGLCWQDYFQQQYSTRCQLQTHTHAILANTNPLKAKHATALLETLSAPAELNVLLSDHCNIFPLQEAFSVTHIYISFTFTIHLLISLVPDCVRTHTHICLVSPKIVGNAHTLQHQ